MLIGTLKADFFIFAIALLIFKKSITFVERTGLEPVLTRYQCVVLPN